MEVGKPLRIINVPKPEPVIIPIPVKEPVPVRRIEQPKRKVGF